MSSSPSKSPTMEHPHPKAANSVSPTIKQHPFDEAEYHHPNHPLTKSESEDDEFSDDKRRLQKEKDASDANFLKSFPPGFRFNPTDEELVLYYLQKKINSLPLPPNRIMEVNLYLHNPETLAGRYERYGEKEWYFFTPRDRKYPNGIRPNRAAGDGYWKATGADRPIRSDGHIVGYRKALVFYMGKAPKGTKTNWIMHEFRVSNSSPPVKRTEKDMRLDHWVLCRIYKKEAGGKNIKNQGTNHEEDHEEEEIISAPSPEDMMNKMEEMSSTSQQSDVTNFNRPPMEYSVHANPNAAASLDSTLMAYFDYLDSNSYHHHHHPAASPLLYGEANPNYHQHPHFQVDLIDNNVFHQSRLHQQFANSYASMGQKQFAPSPTEFSNQKYMDVNFPEQKEVAVVTFSNNQSVQPVEVPSMQQAQSVQPVLDPVPSMRSTHQQLAGVKQSQSLSSDQGFQDDLEYLKFIDPDLLH